MFAKHGPRRGQLKTTRISKSETIGNNNSDKFQIANLKCQARAQINHKSTRAKVIQTDASRHEAHGRLVGTTTETAMRFAHKVTLIEINFISINN